MNSLKQSRHGLMVFNTNDEYVGKSFLHYGEFSEGEIDLFRAIVRPGWTVLDVGANIGAFTIPLAQLVGPQGTVFAFEPQRLAYYTLCGNVAVNSLTNVIAFQRAVGNSNESIKVVELDYRQGNNFGGLSLELQFPENASFCVVRQLRVDELGASPHFMKIDVEGMERDVLLGSLETINRSRPILYVENDRKEKSSSLIRLLRKLRYKLHFHTPPLYNPDNFCGNTSNCFHNIVSINMLCVPEEQPMPVDPEQFGLTFFSDDQNVVVLGSGEPQTAEVLKGMEQATIRNLLSMADGYAERVFDRDKAMSYLNQAIAMQPDNWELWNKACPILVRFGDYQRAVEYLDEADSLNPNPSITFNRAVVDGLLGRSREAIAGYKDVLQTKPDDAEVHFNLAFELLRSGQYEEGWDEYEWRFKRNLQTLNEFLPLLPKAPVWNGEPFAKGARITVFNEQGTGDYFMFARYLALLKERVAHITAACLPKLSRILRDVAGVDAVVEIGEGNDLPDGYHTDFICSVLSLPRIFGTKADSIPGCDQYIHVPAMEIERERKNIGIAWAGGETHPHDFMRSCPLEHFDVLSDLPDTNFFSLQKGPMQRTWPAGVVGLREGAKIKLREQEIEETRDFYDTACLIGALDLVITVDTAIAHLAAAMGKPTWMVVTGNPDWRWGNGETTPWYPSMKIVRGKAWDEALTKVREML